MLIFLGVGRGDTRSEADWLAGKILGLRIFGDESGNLNLSLGEVSGEILLISQFTLLGDCRKGRRPSFTEAADPALARELYEYLGQALARSVPVAWGRFGAHMEVSLVNDGPVTFILEKNPA
jgi:D-tyrosyl-tRNA(Tyr) deacylase